MLKETGIVAECKVCRSETKPLFEAKVLHTHLVEYFQCPLCNFIQTEQPYWLEEAYEKAITSLDLGLVYRNVNNARFLADFFRKYFRDEDLFLDYGGGYGLFVRLMRDRGFRFYRYDKYCENLFSQHFDLEDIGEETRFSLVTAFELFEHFEEPLEEIKKMFAFSDSILFSTYIQPENTQFHKAEDWWYFSPEIGQHISIYSKKSLEKIAEIFNKKLYTNNSSLHLLTDKKYPANVLKRSIFNRAANFYNRYKYKSLLQSDLEFVKEKLRSSHRE